MMVLSPFFVRDVMVFIHTFSTSFSPTQPPLSNLQLHSELFLLSLLFSKLSLKRHNISPTRVAPLSLLSTVCVKNLVGLPFMTKRG